MGHDRLGSELQIALWVARAQRCGLLEWHLGRDVAGERIVGSGLIRDEIEVLTARHELGKHISSVPEQRHRERPTVGRSRTNALDGIVERVGLLVDVAGREPPVDRPLIHLNAQNCRPGHRRSERLSATHAAEAGGQNGAAREVGGAEVHLACGAERLVRPLQDPLRADVDPRSRRHLSEHRQPLGFEPAEGVPCGPFRHEQRVRDQHARGPFVRPEHPHRLA